MQRKKFILCVIPGFRHEVDENCALLCYYAASSGNCLPTFRDNISVPSSRFKNQICYYPLRNRLEEGSIQIYLIPVIIASLDL